MVAPHRIRRLLIRWPARSEASAFALRAQIRAEVLPVVETALAQACDELATGEETRHVARLELRVAVSDGPLLAEQVGAALLAQARAQLSGLASAPAGTSVRERASTRIVQHAELLLRYLESGSVPWFAASPAADLTTLLSNALRETSAQARVDSLAGCSGAARVAWFFRLFQLADAADWCTLAEAHPSTRRVELARALSALAAEVRELRHVRLLLAAVIASWFTSDPTPATARTLREELSEIWPHAPNAGAPLRETATLAGSPRARHLPEVVREVVAEIERIANEPSALASPVRGSVVEPPPATLPPASNMEPRTQAAREQPSWSSASHAGLVIIHPFLPTLFRALGLIAEHERTSTLTNPARAAATLYFLATGRAEAIEPELDLIKLLIGRRLDEPLRCAEGLLSASDRAECEALLAATIDHWRMLKSSSSEALRSTFLQRQGFLREQERGFLLRVVESPFDVLLAGLPWGIGIVKLPWMNAPLFTEWSTP